MDAATLTPNLGELCPGQDVVLTCSTTLSNTDGQMNWFYNGMTRYSRILSYTDSINTTRDVGFMFSLVLASRIPSILSFRADAAMNGGSVSCRVVVTLSGGGRDTQEPSLQQVSVMNKGQSLYKKCTGFIFQL